MGSDRAAGGWPNRRLRAAVVLAALIGALFAVPNGLAAIYNVNRSDDVDHGVCFPATGCTLRDAINAANSTEGPDNITFQIGVGGSYTISTASALPDITDDVTIDATTQTGYAGAPLIELNGSGVAGSGVDGLRVTGGATAIFGLAIVNFGGAGIAFSGSSSGNLVAGNYIGIGAGGSVAQGNAFGVLVASTITTIGGTNANARNVISGNAGTGVTVSGGTGNQVLGNYIGVDASGNLARPNLHGVVVASNSNTIGALDSGNVVSGNTGIGVVISSASDNTVVRNYVGTDADGSTAVPNGGGGLQIVGGATPASTNSITSNVISGNGGFGVEINGSTSAPSAMANDVKGNVIGLNAAKEHALGNAGPGVNITALSGIGNNTIGGDSEAEQNVIAYNSKGIVTGDVTSRNRFLRNSIHDNAGLGIDLYNDGLTPNDGNDVDDDLVNFPVLDPLPNRNPDGTITLTGTYDGSLPDAHYRFDFYTSPSCDGSGNGEGANWIGTYSTTADAAGDVAIDTVDSLTGYVAPGSKIAATTTDESNSTSEFSACIQPNVPAAINWTVDTNAVDDDGACQNAPDGDCTLPEAINAVNAAGGEQTISFDLPSGEHTISATDLNPIPPINNDVTIDGTSQPGYAGTPIVQLDGSAMTFPPGSVDGLAVDGGLDGSTIRGLSITGFIGAGIFLDVDGSVVQGNYIGVAPDGATAVGNGNGGVGFDSGILISSSNDRIGGTTAATRNVISGNFGAGIEFGDGTGNVVIGNRVGTNAAGTAAVPNTEDGIAFEDVSFQTIGGTAPGEGNLISGNGENGIYLLAYDFAPARFQGNTIGLAADGATPLPNGGAGIFVDGVDELLLGGTAAGAGNVISGNNGTGVDVQFSDDVRIQGNIIGLNATGTVGVPNGTSEVIVDSASDRIRIGGTTTGARNVISGGTTGYGILLDGADNAAIQGNYVGTDKTGEVGLGNADGIALASGANDNTIGGVVAGARNVISGNASVGVRLDLAGSGNRILGNSIGTDKDETDVIPNNVGVELDGTADTIIGSTSPGAGNVIGGSTDAGILFTLGGSGTNTVAGNFVGTNRSKTADLGNDDGMRFEDGAGNDNLVGPDNVFANNTAEGIEVAGGTGNRISANSIYDNGGKGILLDGGNNDQESPTLTSAVKIGANTNIAGTLSSTANTNFFIEYFLTPSCTGEPQGKTYLGFQSVFADEGGNASLSFTTGAGAIGQAITVTATSQATKDTSEFSACAMVTASLSIAPEADTFVSDGAPTANYGTTDYADTYGGFSASCVPLSAPAYTLMRFDLSSIPAGATITHAELVTTTRAGYAQDGDPAHWALFVSDDAWSETGVTWNTRPADGLTTVGDPTLPGGGGDIRQSSLSMGAADVWRAGCNADPDPAGNQSKVFPSTTDGFPRTVADTEQGFINRLTTERNGDGRLSLEVWTPNCPSCPAGANKAYWARYFTREAADPTVRPKLVVSFTNVAQAANVQLTGPGSTPAGAATVKLADVPPSVLLRPQSTAQTAPVNETPVNETPVNETPVNELPVNELPINETPVNELGFSTLASSVPALGTITLASIPLLRPGGWSAALTGTPLATLPLQNVTLRDYYALPADQNPETRATNRIDPITLADLDLSHSILGSLPASALVLANVDLSWLRDLGVWCRLFGTAYCPNGTLSDQSVMAAALQGAPVNETPVNELPVNETPINEIPVNEVASGTPVNEVPINELPVNETPVNELPINETPVNETPINELPVNETPVNELPVNEIMVAVASIANSPVNELPINELATPNAVFVCEAQNPGAPNTVDCTSATLRDAYLANAIRTGVTLKDLRDADGGPPSAFDGITLGDLNLLFDYGLSLRDLVDSLADNTFTLGDYFLLILRSPQAQQGLAWERLDIFGSGLAAFATDGATVPYQATFDVQPGPGGGSGSTSVAVDVTLPAGFLYVPGSSKLGPPGACSGAAPISDPTETVASSGQRKLEWTVPTIVGNSYLVCFTARPGLTLGPQTASLEATPADGTAVKATPANIDVGDTLEPNDTVAAAHAIGPNEFSLSYLTNSNDVDYYRFPAPPAGTIVTIHLSHLPADYDLVAYGPPETQLRPSIASTQPLDVPPLTDTGADLTHTTDTLPSQTLDDLNLQTSLPLVGVSASRGTDPEDIVVVSPGGSGFYTIQVTGYNGATSSAPYMLRVATQPPRTLSTVGARTIAGTVGPTLPTLPTGLNTVFLVNRRQLEGTYGSTRATNVINALTKDSTAFKNLGFPNVILSVDRFTTVQNAYLAWNANPGNPALANAVVQAINGVVDSQIRSQANGAGLKYLVIVGGDQIIPFARLDDFTITSANEIGYASTFGTNTDLFSSLNAGQMLSDDPYASTSPVPYLTRQLYLPNLAVGRLVETPEDIIATLNRFVGTSVNGHLDPQTSLTTGYDFLFDGATAINLLLGGRVGTANAKSLLDNPGQTGDSWALSDLIGSTTSKFLPTGGTAPSITSLNGHASHYQFGPPANDAGLRSALLTTSAVTGSATALTNRLIFSMGCHAGLSVADSVVTAGGASTLDWPQAYAQKGVGAYLGNTGYGYGDSLIVAYSEEINRLFAQRIAAGSTVGNALVAAKQAYFGELGVFGVYDEKSMAEFTLYGLPMWSVSGPGNVVPPASAQQADTSLQTLEAAPTAKTAAAAPAASPLAVIPDPATGLNAETFSLGTTATPIANHENVAGDGKYWDGPDGVLVEHLRPIQPKAYVALTATTGHGALITELKSHDQDCINPVFARPLVDLTGNESELGFGDAAFPSKLQTVRAFQTPSGPTQRLILATGQFFTHPCTTSTNPQLGVQRLFDHIAGRVFRSTSNDYISPAYRLISATKVSGNAAFSVDVTDQTPTGSGTVKEVVVGLRSGTDTDWTFINLTQSQANPARWTGGSQISGTEFEYFVQAVDAAGNVAVSTNKGFYFSGAIAQAPTGDIQASLTGTTNNGWYTPSAGLNISVPRGVTYQVSVDGGAYGDDPGTITGDGVHTVDVRASNGGEAHLIAPVDTSDPTIVINTPAEGGIYTLNSIVQADYSCRDAGSGVVSPCHGTVPNGQPIDTSTVGLHYFTVDAIDDAAGHHTPAKTVTYTVGYRKLLFSSARTTSGDIYAMNADGSGVVQLTATPGLDEQPVWSPDGSRIAFASIRVGSNGLDIYVMDANGQNVKRLTTTTGSDTAPAWSPNGAKIAFQSMRDGNSEIYVMNADGTGQTRLTTAPGLDIEPSWSPDSSRIAFASDRNIGVNIWVMNATPGAVATQLTFTRQAETDPAWSPTDPSKIAFSSNKAGSSGFDLYTISPTGTNQVRLTTEKSDDTEPTWSRDGLKLAFTSNRMSSQQDIYVMNAVVTNTATRLTTNSAADHHPDW
jgi:Tol biopolymer transport system component